jgi:primase-polymerase (primpol)-like protein
MTNSARSLALAQHDRYAAVPASLTDRPQWVAWRWEDRDGGRTKVPYSEWTGKRASTTDPSSWSTFERAAVR